jgi:hypothetical protein
MRFFNPLNGIIGKLPASTAPARGELTQNPTFQETRPVAKSNAVAWRHARI